MRIDWLFYSLSSTIYYLVSLNILDLHSKIAVEKFLHTSNAFTYFSQTEINIKIPFIKIDGSLRTGIIIMHISHNYYHLQKTL